MCLKSELQVKERNPSDCFGRKQRMNFSEFIKQKLILKTDKIFFRNEIILRFSCFEFPHFRVLSAVKFSIQPVPWDKSAYFSSSWDSTTTKCCWNICTYSYSGKEELYNNI